MMILLLMKQTNKTHHGHAKHGASDDYGENDDGHDALPVD